MVSWRMCLLSDRTLVIKGRISTQEDLADLIRAALAMKPFLRSGNEPQFPDEGL